METRRPPWWLWPNLLSLDAPLVAVAWLWMMVKAWRVQYLPMVLIVALAGVVWCIYTIDRILDTKCRDPKSWSARHEFHARHKKLFMVLTAIIGVLSLLAVMTELSMALIGYLIPAVILCAVYFAITVFHTRESEVSYLKNTIAGLCFAYGTAMCAHVQLYSIPFVDLLTSPVMLLFALICIINMVAIDLWEAVDRGEEEGLFAELSLAPVLALLGGGAIFGYLKASGIQDSLGASAASHFFLDEFYLAVLFAAAGMLLLNHYRDRFSVDALRVLGDVALLVPCLIFIAA